MNNAIMTSPGCNADLVSASQAERDPKESPFYKAGADACRAGIKLQDSALRALRPGCKEYDWFIAGYDSVPPTKSKAR